MSGYLGWFTGGGQKRQDAPKKAILGLRSQLDMLQKRETHLNKQIEEQNVIAKKNVTTNKSAAMSALKKKKLHEKALETTQAQIGTIEHQVHAIEETNLNYETLKAMKEAANAMKSIHGNMDIDKVDAVVEEIQEQTRLATEMGEAIGRVGAGNELIDEDDLMAEMAEMEQEALDERMTEATRPPIREPAGGYTQKNKPVEEEEDEEEELRKLQAEMMV